MTKIWTIFLLICLVSTPIFSGEPDKKLHEQCIYPTVLVVNSRNNGYGSGVIVKSDKIADSIYLNTVLTCAHNFDLFCVYHIRWTEYTNWSNIKCHHYADAYVYDFDRKRDLAICCFLSDRPMHVAELGVDEQLFLGNEVFGVGCALKLPPRLDFGRVTCLEGPNGGMQNSIQTIPGDSGGPVFHNYKIVGVKRLIRTNVLSGQRVFLFNIAETSPIKWLKDWRFAEGRLEFLFGGKTSMLPYTMFKVKRFYGEVSYPKEKKPEETEVDELKELEGLIPSLKP